ncbi:MAG: hypothetical protein R3E60_00465 [Alphaproteobacteria bacterium]
MRIHYMFCFFRYPCGPFIGLKISDIKTAFKAYLYGFGLALVVPIALAVTYMVCRANKWAPLHIPYDEIAQQLRSAGFVGGTVYAHNYPYFIAGDLKASVSRITIFVGTLSSLHTTCSRNLRAVPGHLEW